MATVAQRTFSFTLTLSGIDALTADVAEALYAAGCDDSNPCSRDGVVTVWFDREAESLGTAVGSAISNIERAGFKVSRVEVDAASDGTPGTRDGVAGTPGISAAFSSAR